MQALGRQFDIVAGIAPADVAAGATGQRVNLKNAGGVTIVIFRKKGTGNTVYTLQEANAPSGGTAQNLAIIDKYYRKGEDPLTAAETWTEETQTAAATFTADGSEDELVVIEVEADQLSDGFTHVLVNAGSQATADVTAVLYLLRDLAVQRAPQNLANPNAA